MKIHVISSRELKISATQVWNVLSRFSDISWAGDMGRVECEGTGVGMIRRIYVNPESPAVERLDALDENNMSFTYSIIEGMPLPVKNYSANVSVKPIDTTTSLVTWEGTMQSDGVTDKEATDIVKQFYESLLDKLESHLL